MWDESLSINVDRIDRQHKKLVDLLDELSKAMRNGEGQVLLGALLDDLVSYTQFHFATEERLMKEYHFPGYKEHKEKHLKMTQKVLDFQTQHKIGKSFLTLKLHKFLENWVKKHIAKTDKVFGLYLNERGVS